jgi:hypothetical protein
MNSERFKYVKYEKKFSDLQNQLRKKYEDLEKRIADNTDVLSTFKIIDEISEATSSLPPNEYKGLLLLSLQECKNFLLPYQPENALLFLEESYYWEGKFIRLAQIEELKAGA